MNAGWGISPLKSTRFHPEIGGFHLWNLVDFTQISPVKSTQNYKSKCFSKNSSVWWMQGGGYDQGFHPWNLADFTQISPVKSTQIIKASVSAKTLQFDECRVGAMTKDFMKSTRFHPEIWWISPVKSSRFHPDFTCTWPILDLYLIITLKLTFHEIRRISYGFHEIWWISSWNPADFTQISPVKSTQNYKSKCFSKNSSVWWMQGGGFHLWIPPDFTLKLVDFTCEIWWISPRFSPVKSTQNYKSKCFSKNSSVSWMQGGGYDQGFHEIHQISGWNLVDFTCEIQQISPRFHLWNPPKL